VNIKFFFHRNLYFDEDEDPDHGELGYISVSLSCFEKALYPDEVADMRPGILDTEGHQVIRYLKSIVAWHAAIHNLCNHRSKFREFAQNLTVGFVEIQKSDNLNTPREEICQEFFRRNPSLSAECRIATQEQLLQHYRSKFTGTVHAEATLMGLLNYFSLENQPVKYNISITNESLLWQITKPVRFFFPISFQKL